MEEAKFSNLCSHYKDTYDLHLSSIKQRDRLFYTLLIVLSIFTLQLSSAETVADAASQYLDNSTGISLGSNIAFISTLLWLLLFGFSTKYYQVVLQIERQYSYIHSLEDQLNNFYQGTQAFTREGKSYLENFPIFSAWIGILYTVFFPLLILCCSMIRIGVDFQESPALSINSLIDRVSFFLIAVSSVLYLIKLHSKK